jgi:hypothetical protein
MDDPIDKLISDVSFPREGELFAMAFLPFERVLVRRASATPPSASRRRTARTGISVFRCHRQRCQPRRGRSGPRHELQRQADDFHPLGLPLR